MKFILFLSFFIFIFTKNNTDSWTPEKLASYSNLSLVDPYNYLNSNNTILELINNIYATKNFETRIFLIPKIDYNITDDDPDIESFVKELSFLILKGNQEKVEDFIFILFSIDDRLMRIQTGKNVIKYLPDDVAIDYLVGIKEQLRENKYDFAVEELLENIYNRINSKFAIYYEFMKNFFSYLFIFLGILFSIIQFIDLCLRLGILECCCCLFGYNKIDEETLHVLQKIKKIDNKKLNSKNFISSTCVICLEDFADEKENGNLDNHIDENNKLFINEDKQTLNCGHTFHTKCINTWTNHHEKCPICRENIEMEEKNLTEGIVGVQTTIYPSMRNINYSYSHGFYWNAQRSYSNHGNTSSSRSWNISGGGATSSW